MRNPPLQKKKNRERGKKKTTDGRSWIWGRKKIWTIERVRFRSIKNPYLCNICIILWCNIVLRLTFIVLSDEYEFAIDRNVIVTLRAAREASPFLSQGRRRKKNSRRISRIAFPLASIFLLYARDLCGRRPSSSWVGSIRSNPLVEI